jgi:alpha-methylacyl-CoA racemase
MSLTLGHGTGPLRGVRVVELAGIGPGPHACMILADLGADVIRIDRPGGQPLTGGPHDLLNRGRPSAALDLKHPDGIATVLELVETADVLVEGLRPGTTERLGLGPDECLARNPRLVYGRMTGWGQDGPLAPTAGHDLGYVALTGALFGMGQDPGRPMFPSNLVGDFGGGSTYLVIGVLAALLEARVSGEGQVVDAAIVDGTAHLNAMATGFLASGLYREQRAANLLDGGVPFYDVYETVDGRHLAVGSLEPKFYDELVRGLGIADTVPDRNDPAQHAELRRLLGDTIRQRTQAEWAEVFDGSDACVAPVLPMSEAFAHPHLVARATFVERDGITQPAPAPRFSRTAPTLTTPPPAQAGQDTRDALLAWGIGDVDALLASGAAAEA